MTDIAQLGIKIEATDVKKAVDELDRLEKKSGDVERATDKLGTSFKAFGVLAAAAAVAAAAVFAGKVIANTIEQERVIAQLNATLKSTRGAAGLTSDELQRMASELQNVTTYGDETIIGMQSVLLTFTKIASETFPQATAAVLDMSTALGTDLKSSAIQLGKALNDPIQGISALSRVGVSFTDTQKDLIKSLVETGNVAGAQSVILRELQTEFGGSAEAARNTFGGALQGLKNAAGDLLEADGASLPGVTQSINDLTNTLNDPGVKEGFATLTSGVILLTNALAQSLAEIGKFAGGIVDFFDDTESIDEMQLKIDGLAQHIFAIQRETERTSIVEWVLGKDPKAGVAEIEAASKQIAELSTRIEALRNPKATADTSITGIGGGTTDTAVGLPMPTDEQIQEWMTRDLAIYQLQQEALRENESEKELIEREAQERRRMNLLQHYSDEEQWAQGKADKIKVIEEKEKAEQIARGEQAFSTMLGNVAAHNETFFKIQKLYRLSKLAMEAPAAIADSYAWGASWGGPPAGGAMAAIAAVAMAGYASQLASAQYGGSGAGSASAGSQNAVTGTVSPGVTSLFPQDEQQESRGSTTFIINGDIIGTDEYVGNHLLPTIKEAIDRRDYVLVETNSLNGQVLRA